MFKEKLKLVPHKPGSYQMKNKEGVIIYIGKAKDLSHRLASYFNGLATGKTLKMVREVADFEYIITSSELEAFILELNLIKKYNPKYNISLRDDKSYPYIEYIRSPYPKVKVARYLKRNNKKILFGPYPNGFAARKIVELLNRFYPLKKCEGRPKSTCLYYDIKECLGYCVKQVSIADINKIENEILSFLRGNGEVLKSRIEKKIAEHSNNLNYEMALELKKDLDYIKIILDKQNVELQDLKDRDIINYYFDKGYLSLQMFFIRRGKLLGSHNDIIPLISSEVDEVEYYIAKFYEKKEKPKEVITASHLNLAVLSGITGIEFNTAFKGNKKKLLTLAYENAQMNLNNKFESLENDEKRSYSANEELRNILSLDKLSRIDVFDNSNLFGSFCVSGMVVFKEGKPIKNEYRKYKISLEKNDDYHAMKEVIYRRYYRALMEKSEFPDLIIVDGGLTQIKAAKEILSGLNVGIRVCGLKKNNKHRTSELLDGDSYEVVAIDRSSDVFHYLSKIQDEVHKFTINYHKTIRSKGSIASVLDNIDGIGKMRKKELISTFGSIEKMKRASLQELSSVVPLWVAQNIKTFLDNY